MYSAAGIYQQPGQLPGDINVRSRGAYFAGINVLHPVNAHSKRMRAMSGLNPSQSSFAHFVAAPVVLCSRADFVLCSFWLRRLIVGGCRFGGVMAGQDNDGGQQDNDGDHQATQDWCSGFDDF